MNRQEREVILKRLGLEVRIARVKRGISQEELADIAGLHRTYIGMVERAERNISVINLIQIAKALNMSLDELLPIN